MTISIHPSVGVARLGNSPEGIFLAPDKIGGLPYDVDASGNPQFDRDGNLQGAFTNANNFKDDSGRIKRQGQLFRLFDNATGEEITKDKYGQYNIASIEWTVHLANKKATWYQYNELVGNLLYGDANSYANNGGYELFRNPKKKTNRQELIIDPGPRSVSEPGERIEFIESNAGDYNHVHFPDPIDPEGEGGGEAVDNLGELRMDSDGRLIVLGGFGKSGGNEPLTNYGGSDTWHDDISDGPVYCTIKYNNGNEDLNLKAWVIVGSPDFAPEIVNISTLSDTMFDVAVRNPLGESGSYLVPEMYNGDWNDDYQANFQRDILPIIQRIKGYQWVSNVQSMSAFFANNFDFTDNNQDQSSAAYQNRQNYFSYFRDPNGVPPTSQQQQQLFKGDTTYDFPMMPLNSGSNSVSENTIVKFLALNETQYFLLGQWAEGKFNNDPAEYPVHPLDAASVGNCVGLPMCPGIEVTWTVQNPAIYESAYVIKHAQEKGGYNSTGLTPMRDECQGEGCEPGDLTKRMACPWQADFFQCTIQYINFTDPTVNKEDDTAIQYNSDGSIQEPPPTITIPAPPTYYSYWWPPQSPWDVLTGETTLHGDRPVAIDGQNTPNLYVPSIDLNGDTIPKPPEDSGDPPNSIIVQDPVYLPAGQQVNYARGINSFVQMVEHWYTLGFIRNQNTSEGQSDYPYLVETERNHEMFKYQEVPVGAITGNQYDNDTTIPVFSMEQEAGTVAAKSERAQRLVAYLEQRAFKAIAIAPEGLGHPRSGTRARR